MLAKLKVDKLRYPYVMRVFLGTLIGLIGLIGTAGKLHLL